MGSDSYLDKGKSRKNTTFFMKRSIGGDYREMIDRRLENPRTMKDFRFLITNFDNSNIKLAFSRILAYMRRKPKRAVMTLPGEMETLQGVKVKFPERKKIELEFDYLQTEEFQDNFHSYAPVEISRAIHRIGDVSELAFFLGRNHREYTDDHDDHGEEDL